MTQYLSICARIISKYEFSGNCVLLMLLYIGLWFSVISRKEVWYRILESRIWYHPSDHLGERCISRWFNDWIWFSYSKCWRFRYVIIHIKYMKSITIITEFVCFICINRYLCYWCWWCWCRFVETFISFLYNICH